jgi:hypothetical protein
VFYPAKIYVIGWGSGEAEEAEGAGEAVKNKN